MTPLLIVEHLSKYFGGIQAVQDVSFSVEAGERLAIIGPNGAGKTTLFGLLGGAFPPSRGKIFAYGREITRLPAHRRAALGIGRTFQITNLFLRLTVLDNVLLALAAEGATSFNLLRPMFSYSHLYERGEKMLTQWGLWPRRDVPVSSLSYGEQRQMEVILVLVQNPSLLLLDEPTSGLSLEDAKRFVSLIRSFPRNITILLIDHDMDVVFDIADKVLVLHFGRVLASGTPDEVRKNPQVQDVYMGRLHEPA